MSLHDNTIMHVTEYVWIENFKSVAGSIGVMKLMCKYYSALSPQEILSVISLHDVCLLNTVKLPPTNPLVFSFNMTSGKGNNLTW